MKQKTVTLTALNREKSGINGVEPEKWWRYWRLTGRIAVLTALNRKNSGLNDVELEKELV